MARRPIILVVSILAAAVLRTAVPALAAPYLGQKPPGATPRVFAPRVVSTGDIIHSRLVISPDGREMFWTTVDTSSFSTRLLSIREVGGRWTEPEPPSFAKDGSAQTPVFSPDGRRLYFRIRDGKEWATVFMERLASGWSAPRRHGAPLDGSSSFTRSGRVYFSSKLETKIWNTGIFSARLTPDGCSDVAALDSTINVPNAIDYTPWVSPDESFLLFSSNRPLVGDREDMHVHVSFRAADGTWSAPRRVSEIPGRFPSISPDGRHLFFCGDDGRIYWADARIVDALRPARDAGAVKRR
jgi:hypothetical protein